MEVGNHRPTYKIAATSRAATTLAATADMKVIIAGFTSDLSELKIDSRGATPGMLFKSRRVSARRRSGFAPPILPLGLFGD